LAGAAVGDGGCLHRVSAGVKSVSMNRPRIEKLRTDTVHKAQRMIAAEYRHKADAALNNALASKNLAERSRLLGEASYWNVRAEEAETETPGMAEED
jgi:hypothetical protein